MSQKVESILVPTDGSKGAEGGERRGVDLAATLGTDLHVLTVVDTGGIAPALARLDRDRTEHERVLKDEADHAVSAVRRLARSHLSGEITTAVESGVPYRTITDYVDEHDIDLVVMGTHGRSGLDRAVLGSVTEKTIRLSSVPVVAVPPNPNAVEVGDVTYENILVPTDGSQGAEIAVDWGLRLANAYDATVHTVYSVDTSWLPEDAASARIHEKLEQTGRSALETVRERARAAGLDVVGHIGNGPAARVIRSYSEDHYTDLIVMGTHGRSGVERLLLGSVTEAVLRTTTVPVCCVPMDET